MQFGFPEVAIVCRRSCTILSPELGVLLGTLYPIGEGWIVISHRRHVQGVTLRQLLVTNGLVRSLTPSGHSSRWSSASSISAFICDCIAGEGYENFRPLARQYSASRLALITLSSKSVIETRAGNGSIGHDTIAQLDSQRTAVKMDTRFGNLCSRSCVFDFPLGKGTVKLRIYSRLLPSESDSV